ncbi:hypothetical protein TNCV_4564731 [Trichonephila clavipes]|nr:hypothetical protein TNCV_4564731 [Trichonephila clavipes]
MHHQEGVDSYENFRVDSPLDNANDMKCATLQHTLRKGAQRKEPTSQSRVPLFVPENDFVNIFSCLREHVQQ